MNSPPLPRTWQCARLFQYRPRFQRRVPEFSFGPASRIPSPPLRTPLAISDAADSSSEIPADLFRTRALRRPYAIRARNDSRKPPATYTSLAAAAPSPDETHSTD